MKVVGQSKNLGSKRVVYYNKRVVTVSVHQFILVLLVESGIYHQLVQIVLVLSDEYKVRSTCMTCHQFPQNTLVNMNSYPLTSIQYLTSRETVKQSNFETALLPRDCNKKKSLLPIVFALTLKRYTLNTIPPRH